VSLLGGAPQTICKANFIGGGSWGNDDTIVFGDWPNVGLWRVPSVGGTPIALTLQEKHFEERELQHGWPEFLPDGNTILFSSWWPRGFSRIAIFSSKTGERRTLIERGSYARYVPTGHLVYALKGDLLAVPFSLNRLELIGSAIPVGIRAQHFCFSENGTLVYVPGGDTASPERRLVWTDRQGKTEPVPLPSSGSLRRYAPRLSPDGKRLMFASGQDRSNISIFNLERGTLRRLTDEDGDDYWPLWSLDGKRVLFNSNRYGGSAVNLYWKPADGSGPEERLAESEYHQQPQSWSPDGKVLAFTEGYHPETGMDIWMLPMEGERTPHPFLQTRFNEIHPSFSPDGQWLAYVTDESGRREVYARAYPGPGGITQISVEGGSGPVWASNGKELFYRDPGGDKVWIVSFQGGSTPRVGKPSLLFEGSYAGSAQYGRNYEVTPNGQRFLMFEVKESQSTAKQINVVLNWFEELKRKVPTGK
jgi:serine/threonine-protein kinase